MALTKIPSELSSTTGIVDNSNATAITIDSNENVGIGTTSPSGAYSQPSLHIHASGNGAELHLTDGTTGATSSDGMSIFQYANDGYIHMRENGSLRTYINGSERMRIDSAGNVGIGTSSPNSKLDTGGDYYSGTATTVAQLTNKISTYSTLSQGSLYGFGQDSNGLHMTAGQAGQSLMFHTGGSAERVRIDGSGNLLVGTTSWTTGGGGLRVTPSGRSDFSRNTTSSTQAINFANPNGFVGNITLAGSTTTYNTSSDQRLKDNIVDAPSASEDIDAIQVRSFDWKADGSHQKYGMVAQELQTVAPEAVSVPEDSEEMMGVDYSKLVPMLIKEIQSLRNRVAQLEE